MRRGVQSSPKDEALRELVLALEDAESLKLDHVETLRHVADWRPFRADRPAERSEWEALLQRLPGLLALGDRLDETLGGAA